MKFEIGKTYSRIEIQRALGGLLEDYLPHEDDRVVCGCFKLSLNPDAPRIVLIDNEPNIMHWARVFRGQQYPIPVFVKDAGNEWEYRGEFQVRAWYDDITHLGEQKVRTGRPRLDLILILRRVKTGRSRQKSSTRE